MDTVDVDQARSGLLAPMREGTAPSKADASTVTKFDLPRLRWQIPFQDLRLFIAANVEPEYNQGYLTALNGLEQSFEATYGQDEDGSYRGDALHQIVFRWLYLLDDQMMQQMQGKEPLAMIMTGYYAVLLKVPELMDCWFVKGWSQHILMGVYEALGDRHRSWLKWPFENTGLEWTVS